MARMTTASEYALKRSKRKQFFKNYGMVLLFLGPFLFFFGLFCIFPLFYGIVMSLMKYSISDPTQNAWRGLANFWKILADSNSVYNSDFWYSMKNTVLFALILVPLAVIVPLIAAILVNSEPRGYKIFRALIYFPAILPVSASGVIFIALFGTNFGYVNQWIGETVAWLDKTTSAWFVIILLCLWGGWGGNFIILSAGLKNVDKSLYEAASVDGCSRWRRAFAVTLPAIKPQLIVCLFTTIIGYFGLYGQVYVLTNGGPANPDRIPGSTATIMWYLQSLMNSDQYDVYGMVSAMGLTLGFIIGCITGLQLFLTRERKSGTKLAKEFAAYRKDKERETLIGTEPAEAGSAEEGGGGGA